MNPASAFCCLATITAAASAQSVPFFVFENATGANTAGLMLNLELVDGGSYVDFVITNDSQIGGVATRLFIEQPGPNVFSGFEIMPAGVGGMWREAQGNSGPPGSLANFGNPWAGSFASVEAMPSPVMNGIHAGESLTMRMHLSGATYADVFDAVVAQDLRLVTHIQALGQDSVWAVTVPSPSGLGALAIGVGVFACRRRR